METLISKKKEVILSGVVEKNYIVSSKDIKVCRKHVEETNNCTENVTTVTKKGIGI